MTRPTASPFPATARRVADPQHLSTLEKSAVSAKRRKALITHFGGLREHCRRHRRAAAGVEGSTGTWPNRKIYVAIALRRHALELPIFLTWRASWLIRCCRRLRARRMAVRPWS